MKLKTIIFISFCIRGPFGSCDNYMPICVDGHWTLRTGFIFGVEDSSDKFCGYHHFSYSCSYNFIKGV